MLSASRLQRDQPTLHTIRLASRPKFRIGRAVCIHPRRQMRRLGVQASMLGVHGAAHAVSRKCVDVVGLGLLEKSDHIACGHRVTAQRCFEAFQCESCHHEQPRNQRHEQPRHKGEVNTAKVSAGLRIVTGPHRVYPGVYPGLSVRLSTLTL